MKRNRIYYLILLFLTIVAGLASREFKYLLPYYFHLYSGDTLWAIMVFLLLGILFPNKPTKQIALYSLLFSYGIEISQLYHAPWIDLIRNNRLGGLILGFGFLWSDTVCYTVGISIAFFLEILLSKRGIEK